MLRLHLLCAFVILFIVVAHAKCQDAHEVPSDWLGSREGFVQGEEAIEYIASVGAEDNRLKQVTIRLKRRGKDMDPLDTTYKNYETWCEVDSTQEHILRLIEEGLIKSNWKLRLPKSRGVDLGTVPNGEIVLQSERGSVRILLFHSFIVDTGIGCNNSKNAFRSWTLAKAVHELTEAKCGEGISDKQFGYLSGEKILEIEKSQFEKRLKGEIKQYR